MSSHTRGYLAITLFFRTVGCLCPDFDSAIKIAALIITLFVLTSGYLIQYQSEQVWLRWIFYINALGLGFASMMVNEFSRIDLNCDGASLIPYSLTIYGLDISFEKLNCFGLRTSGVSGLTQVACSRGAGVTRKRRHPQHRVTILVRHQNEFARLLFSLLHRNVREDICNVYEIFIHLD